MRSSKRYFALLFLLFALAFAGVNQTNYVQAKETTQKICLYLGQKITLADLPEGEVVLGIGKQSCYDDWCRYGYDFRENEGGDS